MASLKITFGDRQWTLTDQASQCSYGEPVLVSDDGAQLRAVEIAIPAHIDDILGPIPATTAYSIVCHGQRNDGQGFSAAEWSEIMPLLDRFAAQWQQFGPDAVGRA